MISKHREVLEKIALQRAFGVDRTHGERKLPGQYDVNLLGFNYRMNELQAAIGSIQVDRLTGFLQKRKENYEIISKKLLGFEEIFQFDSSSIDFQSSYYCKSIILQKKLEHKRTEVVQALADKGIGTSVYYPRPVPRLTYYKEKYDCSVGQFPEATKIADNSIALPVGPHMKSGDAEYIADSVIEVAKKLL